MGNIYGKPVNQKPVSKPPSPMEAIQKLHRQIETLNLSIKQKSTLAENYHEKAKTCVSQGKPDDAKIWLEKKVRLNTRITQLLSMVSSLEHQIAALESVSVNRDIVNAMEVSSQAMKNSDLSTDKVSDIMDAVRNQIDDTTEVTNILSEPLGDVVDVSDELEKMAKESIEIKPMPAVPQIVHVPVQSNIEEELRKLELAS